MPALMKTQTIGKLTEITLTIPWKKAGLISTAIGAMLNAAGLKVQRLNADGEELYTPEEVFPDFHPGMALKGLRVREDLTQAEMAIRLKIPQSHLSDMERGKRPITLSMAKRIEDTFGMGYKVFL